MKSQPILASHISPDNETWSINRIPKQENYAVILK